MRVLVLFFTLLFASVQGFTQNSVRDSIKKLTDTDYQLMLKELGINDASHTKATDTYTLPDPLVFRNGKKVTSARQWAQRKTEIKEDFDSEIYGRIPDQLPSVEWSVYESKNTTFGNYRVEEKHLIGKVDNSSWSQIRVNIELTLGIPMGNSKAVPVILLLAGDMPGQQSTDSSWLEQILEKGWGFAIINPLSVQPDNGAGLRSGIIGLVNKGQSRKPDDWGALKAWTWGVSKAIDYFEKDPDVDTKRIGVAGLSRYGKAALVAMAYDTRITTGFIGSSGAGGAKILRRSVGEQVSFLASGMEYHWFAPNFIKYGGPLTPNDLSVDAHELIALCAPRPVFISVGSRDLDKSWIDPEGMFIAAVHAGPVYKLLGAKGIESNEMPPVGEGLMSDDIAFRQHEKGHELGPNWPYFIEFADKYFAE